MVSNIFVPGRSVEGKGFNPFGVSLYNTVDKLVRRLAGKFYSIMSDDDIDDLVNDTYGRILENQDKADFEKNFNGWVFRTCQNMVNGRADSIRKHNQWIVELDEDFDDDDAPYDLDRSSIMVDRTYVADREVIDREFAERFWECIDHLSQESRMIAELLMEYTPYKEIARILGCSEDAVRLKVFRVRKELKRHKFAS